MTTLPDPPTLWLVANGYLAHERTHLYTIGEAKMAEARIAFSYEREVGPIENAPSGSRTSEQFAYRPKRDVDPRDVAA